MPHEKSNFNMIMTRQRFLAKQQCVENVIVVDAAPFPLTAHAPRKSSIRVLESVNFHVHYEFFFLDSV